MIDQKSKPQQKGRKCYTILGSGPGLPDLVLLVPLVLVLMACGSLSAPSSEVVVQTALATPTSEPTFTPVPLLTSTPHPSPTVTRVEPTPTATPQSLLSGRILDQDTHQPVAGARVRVGSAATTTDAEGRYTLTGLPPGQYVLSVTHPDYDPGLSSIFTLTAGQELSLDLALYAPDASPYPKDPMLTNPLDPNGAPTAEDAERLARLQGLTGEVVDIWETKLSGEYLVNYKIGEEVRAAVAKLNHEVWELTDDAGRAWWIIKVCGNLASPLPTDVAVATPQPQAIPLTVIVDVDELAVRACASEECTAVETLTRGTLVEVKGCLADRGWCQVVLSGGGVGWCRDRKVRFVAAVAAVPTVKAVLPTATPGAVTAGEGKIAFMSTQHSDSTDIWHTFPDIYIMNPNGSEQRRLHLNFNSPMGTYAQHNYLNWLSPKRLVFQNFGLDRLCIFDLETGRLDFWDVPYDLFDISDLGHKIAYRLKGTSTDIFVANVDGSNRSRVTDSTIRKNVFGQDWGTFGFAISPNGEKIVFGGGGGQDIGIVNTDGSGARILVMMKENGLSDHFDWSPDGQRIVFESAGSGSGPRGVFVVNADGSNLKLLFETTDLSMPVWSPAGQKIAFVHKNQIWVMDADGQNVTQLTTSGFNCCPAWSR
jgi:uncharacterized protein YraI